MIDGNLAMASERVYQGQHDYEPASQSALIRRYAPLCDDCIDRDITITHHADIIAQLKREKLALIATIKELCPEADKRRDVLMRHMERLGA